MQTEPMETVRTVAAMLNVMPSWVYQQCAAGKFPHVRVGKYLSANAHGPIDADKFLNV